MNERNLIITGMMGSGKSTVAPLVADLLEMPLLDTDAEIEKRFGKSVAAIFEDEGEPAFRKAEADLCIELSRQKGMVIATGGGFMVPMASLVAMERHSVFCLDATLQTLATRIEGSSRPLAQKMVMLMRERQAAYQRILHHVDTNNQDPERIATQIAERFKLDVKFSQNKTRLVRMPLQAPYPIMVKEGMCLELPQCLKWLGVKAPRVIVLTNARLQSLVLDSLARVCAENGFAIEWVVMPEGERFKNLDTVERLYEELLALKTRRDDVIVALGGGVVGDVAGFVAATYMRGLHFVQIPTTLLSMVDSSVGGKTGVDLAEGKNLVGAFKQPLAVLIDPTALDTLPQEEYRSGMAEVIKHAMICDRELFERLSSGAKLYAEELIFRALSVKADIVEEDPFEHDRRSLLNLGHTFGHAFETMSGYNMRHGEAVSVGMVAACELSQRLGLGPADLRPRVERVLERFELPTRFFDMRIDQAMRIFQHDKKNKADGMRFVVPYEIGDVRLVHVGDHKVLEQVLLSVAM